MTSCETYNSPNSGHDFGIDRYVGPIDTSWHFWPTQDLLPPSLRAATGTQINERESFWTSPGRTVSALRPATCRSSARIESSYLNGWQFRSAFLRKGIPAG